MAEYEVRSTAVNGFEMIYTRFGRGSKSFVMIPGMSLHPVSESASAIAGAYRRFSEEYTVYVFDRRSDFPENYTIKMMADDTAIAMRALGICDAYVFGVSQGGQIAQYIAEDHPDLIKKLILGSTYARSNEGIDAVFRMWIDLAVRSDRVALNRSFFELVYSREYYESYREVFLSLENSGSDTELERFAALARAGIGFDGYDDLSKIKCPVLVIGADGDRIMKKDASIEIAQKLGCALHIFEGASHAVYDEDPAYKELIYDFFRD